MDHRHSSATTNNPTHASTALTPGTTVTTVGTVEDDFQESPLIQNGEMMMFLARGVGLLVGIVAILSWFMIMVLFRAVLIWCIHWWGISGILVGLAIAVFAAMKYANMSGKTIYNMLMHSCN